MRLTDMMFAFPDILLAISDHGDVRPEHREFICGALAITGWPGLARLVRGQALALRGREFVEAARALGIPSGQIIRRHILPNLLSPIVVASTIDIAGVIIAEATLSFLGIGVQDPLPSWGKNDQHRPHVPLLALPPGPCHLPRPVPLADGSQPELSRRRPARCAGPALPNRRGRTSYGPIGEM